MRSTPWSKKTSKLEFSQVLRLLQESQFLQLNTWLAYLSILYNTISAIDLDPEKNRVQVFFRPWGTSQELRVKWEMFLFYIIIIINALLINFFWIEKKTNNNLNQLKMKNAKGKKMVVLNYSNKKRGFIYCLINFNPF